jgi:hypothetical protein
MDGKESTVSMKMQKLKDIKKNRSVIILSSVVSLRDGELVAGYDFPKER